MKDFKIRVRTPEESTIVQQLLFKLGYKWNFGETTVQLIDYPFLYFNDKIQYGDLESMFLREPSRELTLDQLLDEIENNLNK